MNEKLRQAKIFIKYKGKCNAIKNKFDYITCKKCLFNDDRQFHSDSTCRTVGMDRDPEDFHISRLLKECSNVLNLKYKKLKEQL